MCDMELSDLRLLVHLAPELVDVKLVGDLRLQDVLDVGHLHFLIEGERVGVRPGVNS